MSLKTNEAKKLLRHECVHDALWEILNISSNSWVFYFFTEDFSCVCVTLTVKAKLH